MSAPAAARFLRSALVVPLVFLAACASNPGSDAAGEGAPELDCHLVEVGQVTLSLYGGRSIRDQMEARGIDRLTEQRTIYEEYIGADGSRRRRAVGVEGNGWRYADPACRHRIG